MALSGWKAPTSTFPLPGGDSITVRAFSVEQLVDLVLEDKEALVAVFQKITGRDDVQAVAEKIEAGEAAPSVADIGIKDVAGDMLTTAPKLVAKIIAWAAREPEAVGEAAELPFPTQTELLVEIGRLTFETTAPGKFLEAVITLAQSANTGLAVASRTQSSR